MKSDLSSVLHVWLFSAAWSYSTMSAIFASWPVEGTVPQLWYSQLWMFLRSDPLHQWLCSLWGPRMTWRECLDGEGYVCVCACVFMCVKFSAKEYICLFMSLWLPPIITELVQYQISHCLHYSQHVSIVIYCNCNSSLSYAAHKKSRPDEPQLTLSFWQSWYV